MSRFAGFLLVVSGLMSGAETMRPAPRLSSYYKLVLTYDTNVFRYSDSDLDSFRISINPDRFPVRSADDLDAALSAGLKYRFKQGRRFGHLGARFKSHLYVSNQDKSYGLGAVEASVPAWSGARCRAEFIWMPGYLIRYYRPAGQDDYRACRFTEFLVRAEATQELWRLSLTPYYAFEVDDYLSLFDYYDTRAHRPGVRVGFEVVRGLDLAAEYGLKLASARGPVPDISYLQYGFRVWVSSRPKNLDRLSFGASYGHEMRTFTTENSGELDPSHAGREDLIEDVELEVGYRLGNVKLVLAYQLAWREAFSPYSERIEDIKQYGQNRVSLGAVVTPGLGERSR
ncbi:MAG: hypothetical protein JSU73_08685 [candidate division WOR-3 bacterium]|nr:MAG: hypothetical protein JSU73_08685 [candidate division WOR-3 bacterium]